MYIGFGSVFLLMCELILAIITVYIYIVSVIIWVKYRENLSILEMVTAGVYSIIRLIYLTSESGLLKHFALCFIYVFIYIGIFFL